jgi:hypothetical protein
MRVGSETSQRYDAASAVVALQSRSGMPGLLPFSVQTTAPWQLGLAKPVSCQVAPGGSFFQTSSGDGRFRQVSGAGRFFQTSVDR